MPSPLPPHVHEQPQPCPRLVGWKDSPGRSARAGVTRDTDRDLLLPGSRENSGCFHLTVSIRCVTVTGSSSCCHPRGPGQPLFTRRSLRWLTTPSPKETMSLAVTSGMAGSRLLVSKAHLAAQATLHQGHEITGILLFRKVFGSKIIFNINFDVSATPT